MPKEMSLQLLTVCHTYSLRNRIHTVFKLEIAAFPVSTILIFILHGLLLADVRLCRH